jgi:hypothetical protein
MYRITSLNDILIVLVPIFTNFPLLSTKLLDFNDFLKAINIKSKYVGKNLPISKLNKITKLKINMNRGRKKISVKEINQLSNQVNITSFWLLWFIEAEGTFGIKNLTPYFQIAQLKKSYYLINSISTFLNNLPLLNKETLKAKKPLSSIVINNKTDVLSLTINDIDSLYGYIMPFLQYLTFYTRKSIDFKFWCVALKIHKFGYIYLPSPFGRYKCDKSHVSFF